MIFFGRHVDGRTELPRPQSAPRAKATWRSAI
jgi:hypothetical protein